MSSQCFMSPFHCIEYKKLFKNHSQSSACLYEGPKKTFPVIDLRRQAGADVGGTGRVPPAGFPITSNTVPTSVLQITAAKSGPLVGVSLLCFHLSCTLTSKCSVP